MALSQLNPQIIGAEMEHGFAGSYARQPDMIVVTRPVGEKEPLPFGMALMYDAGYVATELQRRLQDALLADDRIIGLKNYEYSINGQNLTVSFTVETVYGDVETGTEVKF